jgi:hypothetical protein
MNLYTNDPNNRLKTVALSGQVFEPNTLTLEGGSQADGSYILVVGMDNYTDIVAIQYDLHWRSDMSTSQTAFTPLERMNSHSYSVTSLGDDSYRIIIYSMANAMIAGYEGEVHQLVFTPQSEVDYSGSVITIDNIILSNATGVDKSSKEQAELLTMKENVGTNNSSVMTNTQPTVRKILDEGQVMIIRDGKVYSVLGQEM